MYYFQGDYYEMFILSNKADIFQKEIDSPRLQNLRRHSLSESHKCRDWHLRVHASLNMVPLTLLVLLYLKHPEVYSPVKARP